MPRPGATRCLDLAEGLALPVEAVTETFGIVGIRGSGKTTTARRLVEQITHAGQQATVVDPLGVWPRSTSTGKSTAATPLKRARL